MLVWVFFLFVGFCFVCGVPRGSCSSALHFTSFGAVDVSCLCDCMSCGREYGTVYFSVWLKIIVVMD